MRWQGVRINRTHNGERVHTAKLCADDVRLIDALINENVPLSDIARKFNVSRNAVWDIKQGYTWKHITGIGK